MSGIQICGGRPIEGEIRIQGSKNAVLPMMAASILHDGITVIENVPRIQDVSCMMGILEYIGCKCILEGNVLSVDSSGPLKSEVPEWYVRQMRSSVILLGALLGRNGRAKTSYPGGCSIGKRPIDLHLKALERLGAVILEDREQIQAFADGLFGNEIRFPIPSVGATENALLGAVKAKGRTVIRGAAKEPEIQAFCRFLTSMGASIHGIGESCLTVEGVEQFHDSVFQAPGDRIVAGTYLMAAMAAGGEIRLNGIASRELSNVIFLLRQAGGTIREGKDWLLVTMESRAVSVSVSTEPYPGFPTDLQSPFMALMAGAKGECVIEERIFEGRYETVGELKKMGADITIKGRKALIRGTGTLTGTEVEARDLRGGAALAVAALGAEGKTLIRSCQHIERGYEDICRDFRQVGADIQWIRG